MFYFMSAESRQGRGAYFKTGSMGLLDYLAPPLFCFVLLELPWLARVLWIKTVIDFSFCLNVSFLFKYIRHLQRNS